MEKIISASVDSKYIRFPINKNSNSKRVKFFYGEKLFMDFDLRLDEENGIEYVYYDISEYIGKEISVAIPEECRYTLYFCNEKPNIAYPSRPYIHFTAPFGWINDPNGLVEYTSPVNGEKTYHMFYQHNPYDTGWGNMHWGHAVSKDLLRWEHRPVAVYPDKYGTVFSGSAIIDKENRTGLKKGEEDVLLLYYTAAGGNNVMSEGQPFTQCLAYSTDGGETFNKYENNPVLPHILSGNRDPKVVWCDELSCYIMALYLEGNEYALYRSDDLINWTLLQRFDFPNDAECPDIYPLNADGDPSKRKWIISGASYRYMVCECKNGKFEIIQQSRPLNYGGYSYASQTFSNVSDRRRINIAWQKDLPFKEESRFNGQMSVPLNITLKTDETGYSLCAKPIDEIKNIIKEQTDFSDIKVNTDTVFSVKLEDSAYMFDFDFSDTESTVMTVKIFGNDLIIDREANTVTSGNLTLPFASYGKQKKMCAIADRYSLELFMGDGEIIATAPINCIDKKAEIEITAKEETTVSLTVSKLTL